MKPPFKSATSEIRERVLQHKLGQVNLPRFTGVPSPDDMAYVPTSSGYRSVYLYHHQIVAESDVDVQKYRVNSQQVELVGTITTWALEEDGTRGHQCSPLHMRVPVQAFEGLAI